MESARFEDRTCEGSSAAYRFVIVVSIDIAEDIG
jgi:hypothetical protein